MSASPDPKAPAAATGPREPGPIVFLCTTFPKNTETFLQRDLRGLLAQGLPLEIVSIWGGKDEWEGHVVRRFRRRRLWSLLWKLPWWAVRRPQPLARVLELAWSRGLPDRLNLLETAMGLGFALVEAGRYRKLRPALLHGAWATMPATAAWLLSRLCDCPYSFGAHAYDVFRHGGDWLLPAKLRGAALVHTSTASARDELRRRGARDESLLLSRRGLNAFPPLKPLRRNRQRLRLLSVGRLVNKKGYRRQLWVYRGLLDAGVDFEARVIGGGPLQAELERRIRQLGLTEHVQLLGALPGPQTQAFFTWADVFLFTGRVAPDGDRDGLPNVIPEAMAHGLPIVTTPIAGTTEAIEDGKRGQVLVLSEEAHAPAWVQVLQRLQRDAVLAESWRLEARRWVEANFNAERNTQALGNALRRAAKLG
ncbi:MAG: glycosyltransferase family 4 protein [Opitutales bacterium]